MEREGEEGNKVRETGRYLSSLGTGGGNRKSSNRREQNVGAGNIFPLNPPC